MLAERDKHMSEQEKPSRFMEELDRWTEANVIELLAEAANKQFDPELLDQIKKAVRTRVLESYRNGQAAGPRPAGFPKPNRAGFGRRPQEGGRYAYAR
jgi:hypothetical protein